MSDISTPTSPRSVVELSLLAQIAYEVSSVEEEIIATLPPLDDNASDAEQALRRSDVAHKALLRLGHKEKITSAARRYQLYQSYNMELWRNVRIPLMHPNGEPTGEYYTFESFSDYFMYVAEQWGIRAPSSLSILRSGATVLLPAANAGLIASSDGRKYTVEDILGLDEHTQQLLIGVANRALNPAPGHEAQPVETVGQAADIIMAAEGDYDQAVVQLKNAGLVGTKTSEFDKFTIYTYDAGDKIVIVSELTPYQYRSLLMALKTRAVPASSTPTEMTKLLNAGEQDEDESEDYRAAFAAQLARHANGADGR